MVLIGDLKGDSSRDQNQSKYEKTTAQGGAAGSVRLLLTKNPECFLNCPG